MSSTTPARITLASSTKISLHERFTKLAKTAKPIVKTDKIKRVGAGVKLKSSARNRNLALQMGNRPTVKAALKIKNRTLKQRLGGGFRKNNNPAILKPTFKRQFGNQTRNLKQRLGGKVVPNRLGGGVKIIRPRNQLQQRLGNPNNRGARLNSFNNKRIMRNQNNKFSNRINNKNNQQGNGYVINRVNNNNNNAGFKNRLRFKKNLKGRLQNAGIRTNFRRRNNNNGKQQINKNVQNGPKTRENLDNDLDNYMKQTKNHLDADLDTYMAQTSANAI